MKIRIALENLLRDESGVTFAEYAFLLALIAVAAIAAITLFGGHLGTLFKQVGKDLKIKKH